MAAEDRVKGGGEQIRGGGEGREASRSDGSIALLPAKQQPDGKCGGPPAAARTLNVGVNNSWRSAPPASIRHHMQHVLYAQHGSSASPQPGTCLITDAPLRCWFHRDRTHTSHSSASDCSPCVVSKETSAGNGYLQPKVCIH